MATSDAFAGHVSGTAYLLTREQFAAFAAISLPQPDPDSVDDRGVVSAFWADIAAFEARRVFNPFSGCCSSQLIMDTSNGDMHWWYRTTSGTELEAIEYRVLSSESAPGYPGVACSDTLPQPIFMVTIPEDRDQPGRYHWRRLREGGSYCG